MSQKIEKGKLYSATHKESGEKVELLGINTEADLVVVNTIPLHIDALSHYKALKPSGDISEEQSASRKEFFGENWEN